MSMVNVECCLEFDQRLQNNHYGGEENRLFLARILWLSLSASIRTPHKLMACDMSLAAAVISPLGTAEHPPAYSDAMAAHGRSNFHQRSISFGGFTTPSESSRGRFLPDDVEDQQEDHIQLPMGHVDADPHDLASTGSRDDAVIHGQPPNYTPFDEQARVFSICNGSVINIINSERIEKPRYQLRQLFSKSGRLWRLQIRRLLPSESRRLSMSSANVDFDLDTMLYEAENLALHAVRNRMEVQIKGRKAGTLQGHIELCDRGRDGHEFKHCTRPASKHWSSEATQKKMNRWGYKAELEIEKTSLFTCRSVGQQGNTEWKRRNDLTDEVEIVAIEMEGQLVLQKAVSDKVRDSIVTCWAAKHWSAGSLNSGRPPDVKLSKWLTIS